jgi:DNA repair protein RecO (recombination protein O)
VGEKFALRAMVIRAYDSSESGKNLVLLGKDSGKIIVSARGAKNAKSKFLAAAQPFCYADFTLYKSAGFISVAEAELITNFSVFYTNFDKLIYGTYFLELVDKTVMPGEEANNIMLLLIKCLQKLKSTNAPKKITAVFQTRLLSLLGFGLNTKICSSCGADFEKQEGRDLKRDNLYFSQSEGFICIKCSAHFSDVFKTAGDISYIIDYITGGLDKCFMFNISDKLLNELCGITDAVIKNQLDINTNSLKMLYE